MALKALVWIGSSLRDLVEFSEKVKDEIGYSLYLVQMGKQPKNAKTLKGFGGAWH